MLFPFLFNGCYNYCLVPTHTFVNGIQFFGQFISNGIQFKESNLNPFYLLRLYLS